MMEDMRISKVVDRKHRVAGRLHRLDGRAVQRGWLEPNAGGVWQDEPAWSACADSADFFSALDVRNLGFPIAQTKGNGVYRGSCVCCYGYDVRQFHANACTT